MSDLRLVEALRLLAERPEILAAAIAMAKGDQSIPTAPAPTIAELWNDWIPWAQRNMKCSRLFVSYGRTLQRTKIPLPDGREVTLFELPWKEVTAEMADFYRDVRRKDSSGRLGKDGNIGTVCDATINRELGALQSMFKYYRKQKKIPYTPFEGFYKTSEAASARRTYLTPEQAEAFIKAGCPMWQDITTTAYRCAGMRHTEVRLLQKSEIDWEAKVINLSSARNKNGRARVVPFPDDVEAILKHHCGASRGPYVFVDHRDPERKRPVGGAAMQYWMEKARAKSGLVGVGGEAVVIHSFRHAGVTRLITEGAPEALVKAAAGMCNATFQRYCHFSRPQQDLLRSHMNRSGGRQDDEGSR